MSHQLRLHLRRPGFELKVDLTLPERGITVLFGASGSGKTTLLRCVAGLERASGRVQMGEALWQDDAQHVFVPTWQRQLGMVFQEASLFAHLDVMGNLRYGLQRQGSTTLPTEVIDLLGIAHLLQRRVQDLSGGERQRVAIARALATRPKVLLLDEPMSAIDHARRQEILPWLEKLRDELRIPMLYVTHAPDEVARLADHLVVLANGQLQAQGSAMALLSRVQHPVIQGNEAAALIEGVVALCEREWHLARVDFSGGCLWVRDDGLRVGQAVRLRVLARDVSLATQAPVNTSIQNQFEGVVDAIAQDDHPSQSLVRVRPEKTDSDATFLIARITNKAIDQLGLQTGTRVWAQVKSVALVQ